MKTDYTLYIKGKSGNRTKGAYYIKHQDNPPIPKNWDKNNFITWIICGSPPNAELPKVINYWELNKEIRAKKEVGKI